jgi:hypothetical protein
MITGSEPCSEYQLLEIQAHVCALKIHKTGVFGAARKCSFSDACYLNREIWVPKELDHGTNG